MYSDKNFRTAPCHAANTYVRGNARVQFLTSRLVRFEWQENGSFEDRQTLAVVNRNLGPVEFSVRKMDGIVILSTKDLKIELANGGGEFSPENLKVSFKMNGETVIWKPGTEDTRNLGGTIRTLDGANGCKKKVECKLKNITQAKAVRIWEPINLGKGFVSRSGWSLIDDSKNIVIDMVNNRKWVAPRPAGKCQDWYLAAYGHDYKTALADAAKIFGGQPLPPRYALGYWWSRYWAYSDDQIEELVRSFDRIGIPIDVMVIDMDWHLEGWTGYTWDKRYFHDPGEFLAYLHRKGLKVSLNLHPADGVGRHEEHFEKMAEAMDLNPEKIDKVDFDITDPQYMENYFKLLHHPEEQRGIDFWWMDWQQGKSSKMPGLDTLPWINQLHWEDMENRPDRKDKRPLIFSRFGGHGAGRYVIGFSGDTYSTWESLAFQPYFTATAANVLYGYWSHDIGGHMPGTIDPELFTRWLQFGIYSPVLRTHTTKNAEAERRVWEYPCPYNEIMMETIRRRYEIVPYIYTENRKAFDTGVSLCHPVYYDYPECDNAYEFKGQYMFGEKLLVAPVTKPVDKDSETAEISVFLPEGQWFDIARGEMESGGRVITKRYMINEIPVFARPGTVLPAQRCRNRLNNKCYKDLLMTVYPGDSGSYTLYEDDGVSTGYLKDKYVLIKMSHKTVGNVKEITIVKTQGGFDGFIPERSLEIRLEGATPPETVSFVGKPLNRIFRLDEAREGWTYRAETASAVIKLPEINLESGATVKIHLNPALPPSMSFGLKALFSRLERVITLNTLLTSGWVLHEQERLPQDLHHASRRISMNPETFEAEIGRLRELIVKLPEIIDTLGHTTIDMQALDKRINTARAAINLLATSGWIS